ncbi:c-type cytochrome [Ancylobacter terrae]|uniref:c-type cytochrome n=1 Tax=Ancylobacter sp. sgz301288 TaxID=3342077 RepID=UPI00385AC960
MHKTIAISALGGLLLAATIPSAGAAENSAQIKRGEYLAGIMDCGGCHTPGVFLGKPDMARRFAGSEVGFQIPGLGIFYPPNLTSDKDTGLGNWSEADIVKAVTKGERPDGRVLAPAMPYHAYSSLNAADAKALAGYLKSLKPIVNQVPAPVGPSGKASAPYLTVVAP